MISFKKFKFSKTNFVIGFAVLSVITTGCQNRPCREIQAEKMAKKNAENPAAPGTNSGSSDIKVSEPTSGAAQLKVKVYKPDGTLQCGMGSRIALETMEKELKGIKVLSRANSNDGLMRIQVCGAPTGQSNVYEISRTDLEKAIKFGFKEWTAD